jgi:hypothetical protein
MSGLQTLLKSLPPDEDKPNGCLLPDVRLINHCSTYFNCNKKTARYDLTDHRVQFFAVEEN